MHRILSELSDITIRYPGLRWAVPMMQGAPFRTPAPRRLPVCDAILRLPTPPQTTGVVTAIKDAAPRLHWQQTYTEADGLSRDWLDNYGWVDVVGPSGPFVRHGIRVAIAYWGAHQTYPAHAHEPEETYVVLAGGANFRADDRPDCHAGPGDLIRHAPWQVHAMTMCDQPLLVAAFWRGEGLEAKSRLDVTLEDRG